MRKYIVLPVLLALMGRAAAQEQIVVDDTDVPQGGQSGLVVGMSFEAGHDYVSYQFTVELPEGISLVADDYGKAAYTLADNQPANVFVVDFPAFNGIFKCYSSPSVVIRGHEGPLVTIPVQADAGLPIGTELTGRLSGIVFTHINATAEHLQDVTFGIKVTEKMTVLDENATTLPGAAEGVKVRVLRTINAGQWSTICLPFAMTEEQVKTAFGDDVELADFRDTQSVYDDDDNVTGITLSFDDVAEIEANHPYIIKVSSPVTEFTVEGVDIDPAEDDALVEVDNGLTGRRRVVFGGLYGTYHAQTVLEENSLFLSGNKFWYSTGQTRMKAFRAYFYLLDVLTEVEEGAASRIVMAFGGDEVTGIPGTVRLDGKDRHVFFDLQGRRVQSPGKGLYIKNRKKTIRK